MDNSFARKKVDPLLILGCLFHAAEFHSLCPNGLGLYYDEGLMYSLPAYHGVCHLTTHHMLKSLVQEYKYYSSKSLKKDLNTIILYN